MDRRFIAAILLMMLVAIVPTFIWKPAPKPAGPARVAGVAGGDSARAPAPAPDGAAAEAPFAPPVAEDTVVVTTPLVTWRISTRGARIISAELARYRSLAKGAGERPVELVNDAASLLGFTLSQAGITLPVGEWAFTPSGTALDARSAPATLTLTGEQDGLRVALTYTFAPDDYRVGVSGQVTGLDPSGGLVLVNLGRGIRTSEHDPAQDNQAAAFVTYRGEATRHDFSGLDAGVPDTVAGPFRWAAVKSKYFVTALFAADTARPLTAVQALLPAERAKAVPLEASVNAGVAVPGTGAFAYTLYAGPMEYDRLKAMGQDFDDVNPYGWPGFRTVIRFFTVPVRWLLVWMHENLHLAYGWVLILFGLLIRVVLWPLNQKAMQSSMQMQAIQPQLQEIQKRYADNPQRAQQEQMRLFRENKVNPLAGCWLGLLPMPVFLALFVVFQYAIELRGTPFAWLPDLSRADPLFIIPLLMGATMFVQTKLGQLGMPPNPQAKVMLYALPVMFTVFGFAFPSGLNLYYAASNVAGLPQQWLLTRARLRQAADG